MTTAPDWLIWWTGVAVWTAILVACLVCVALAMVAGMIVITDID